VGESFFKKGIPPSVVAIFITRSALSLLSSPCSSAVVAAMAAMALLDPPERLQLEATLNLVRNLLRWDASTFVGSICVSASAHGDLTTGEFMLFVSNLPSGLVQPISSFFRWRCTAPWGWHSPTGGAWLQGCSSALRWWRVS
jgi:hypothetical protein